MNALKGFLVTVHCPAEERLDVEVDASDIPWDRYKGLVEELQDLLSEIDREYSPKSELVKGRSLRAMYRRLTIDTRSRKLKFSPFPSSYKNVLRNTRAFVYEVVNKHCLVIEQVGNRKLYLLPVGMAPGFVKAIEELNEKVIDPLNEKIREFMAGDDYFRIMACLKKYGIEPDALREKSFHVSRYYADVLPVDFSYDPEADEYFRRPEVAKEAAVLRKMIERKHREYVAGILRDVIGRLEPWLRGDLRRLRKRRVDELIDLCRSAGLSDVADEVLKPIREALDLPADRRAERLAKAFGLGDVAEAIRRKLGLP